MICHILSGMMDQDGCHHPRAAESALRHGGSVSFSQVSPLALVRNQQNGRYHYNNHENWMGMGRHRKHGFSLVRNPSNCPSTKPIMLFPPIQLTRSFKFILFGQCHFIERVLYLAD